jgi:hypothetical protein
MNCETVSKQMPLFLYGELSLEEEQSFQDHLEVCGACRREFEAEQRLHDALNARQEEPHPALLARCRRDLAVHLPSPPARRSGLHHWWERIVDLRVGALARPVGALALVALGFFAARWTSGPAAAPRLATGTEPTVTRIRYLNPEPSGNVQVQVEETRQRTFTGRPEDDQIRRLLMAAARESSDPGVRAESMDLLKARQPRTELRPVLLYALQHDPNPGVRLKALDALKNDAANPEVRDALASVLLADDNPGVRAQAIDLLVLHKGESTVPVLQELVQKEDNTYVRLRCQKALEEMNASIGTF